MSFEYLCINCGNWKEVDFWECEKCGCDIIMEVSIGEDGKVIDNF